MSQRFSLCPKPQTLSCKDEKPRPYRTINHRRVFTANSDKNPGSQHPAVMSLNEQTFGGNAQSEFISLSVASSHKQHERGRKKRNISGWPVERDGVPEDPRTEYPHFPFKEHTQPPQRVSSLSRTIKEFSASVISVLTRTVYSLTLSVRLVNTFSCFCLFPEAPAGRTLCAFRQGRR